MKRIIIDCGHGGTDSGATGVLFLEKVFNLLVGKMVGEKLTKYNCEVLYTRTNDNNVSLEERCRLSNINNCEVFLSIHCNSASNVATGFESYGYYSNTSLQSNVHNEVAKILPIRDRGMKTANFYVLKHTRAKAILLELGFINNVKDSQVLEGYKEEITNAIVRGIVKECGLSLRTNNICTCECKCK